MSRGRVRSEIEIAWSLADAVKGELTDSDRCATYLSLGAGNSTAVIVKAIGVCLTRRVILSDDLLTDLFTWIDGYTQVDGKDALHRRLSHYVAITHPRGWSVTWPPEGR